MAKAKPNKTTAIKTETRKSQSLFQKFINNLINDISKSSKKALAKIKANPQLAKSIKAELSQRINKKYDTKTSTAKLKRIFKKQLNISKSKFTNTISEVNGIDTKLGIDRFDKSLVSKQTLKSMDYVSDIKEQFTRQLNMVMDNAETTSLKDMEFLVNKATKGRVKKNSFLSRNVIKSFNSVVINTKAKDLGVTKAIWRSVSDARTRDCHHKFDGKEYDIDKGLYCDVTKQWETAGSAFNCRCYNEFVIPED